MVTNCFDMFVDEKYGIINSILNVVRLPTQPKIWVYTAIGGYINQPGHIMGSDIAKTAAKKKAVFNYLKFYCNNIMDLRKNLLKEYIDDPENEVSFGSFADKSYLCGNGIGASFQESIESACAELLCKFILKKLVNGELKLSKIDILNSMDVRGFFLNYINRPEINLYKVNDFSHPAVIGCLELDDMLLAVCSLGIDYLSCCKEVFLKLSEFIINSCHFTIELSEDSPYNVRTIVSKTVLEKSIEEVIINDYDYKENISAYTTVKNMFLSTGVFDITTEDLKRSGYRVHKVLGISR